MKEVFRNEILERGQIVLLYYAINWQGTIRGVGELVSTVECETRLTELWTVSIQDEDFIKWSMLNPNILTKDLMRHIINA